MIDNRLWEALPETPDSFRRMVKQTVADELTRERKKKGYGVSKAAAAAVICALAVGTTVGAANISKLKDYIAGWNDTVPEESIVEYDYDDNEKADMVQGINDSSVTGQDENAGADNKAAAGNIVPGYDEIRSSLSELEKKNLEELKKIYITGGLMSEEEAEKKICDSWMSEPFLLIDEIYMDGSSLYYTAHLADGCSIKPLNSKDHAYVNGVDCLSENFEETDEPGHYAGSINLTMNASDEGFVRQGEELALMLNLYVDEKTGETKLFSFSDKNWSELVDTMNFSGGEYELSEYGSVRIDKLLASPSKFSVKMTYLLNAEGLDKLNDMYGYGNESDNLLDGIYVEDSNGKRYNTVGNFDGVSDVVAMSVEDVSEGIYGLSFEFDISRNFNMDTEYISFIPYTMDRSEDGKLVPGTEQEITELGFQVSVK